MSRHFAHPTFRQEGAASVRVAGRQQGLAVPASSLAWVAALLLAGCAGEAPSSTPETSAVDRGSVLYVATCQRCHGDREGRDAVPGAPPHGPAGHTWHHPDAQLIEWVLEGRSGGAMPAFKGELSREDVEAILAYIKTWWTDDQRASQADVSRRYQDALDALSPSP